MNIKFYNKIDHFRKLGDFIACVIFLIIAVYLYIKKDYMISLFLFMAGICDLLFTIDALKIHGINQLLNIKLILI